MFLGHFFIIQKKVPVKIIPFIIVVEENAHQIPFRPIEVFPRIIASGILALVKRMLMMLHRFVLSGYGTDGSKLDAQKGFAESDDNQIADSSCNGRRFVEEDRGDRGWCKDKDQSDQ